jgi:hypothetical protein
MALLKSVDTESGVDFCEYRDNLYYNRYTYRARFILDGIRLTWYNKLLHTREETIKEFLLGQIENDVGFYKDNHKQQWLRNVPVLIKFVIWKKLHEGKDTVTIRTEHSNVSIFSNDLALLKTIQQIDPELHIDYSQALPAARVGVKQFVRQPKHAYRVYMKSQRVTSSLLGELQKFFSAHSNTLFPCSSFYEWLDSNQRITWKHRFIHGGYFVDYDDEQTLSYLALMYGDILGKKYKLERRTEDNLNAEDTLHER